MSYTYMYSVSYFFHYDLYQDIEYSSLCYTVGLYPSHVILGFCLLSYLPVQPFSAQIKLSHCVKESIIKVKLEGIPSCLRTPNPRALCGTCDQLVLCKFFDLISSQPDAKVQPHRRAGHAQSRTASPVPLGLAFATFSAENALLSCFPCLALPILWASLEQGQSWTSS